MIAVGLGSNLGDRERTLRHALAELAARVFDGQNGGQNSGKMRVSGFYESDALLPEGAPSEWDIPFLNLAAGGETRLAPSEVLAVLQTIERELGRARRERWAPRELDLDLLAWEGERIEEPNLTVPHAALLGRPFALLPLLEVFPSAPRAWLEQARHWTGRGRGEAIPFRTRRRQPTVVGILNITPDSFSDGGLWAAPDRAVSRALELGREGASVVDLGAESTRPGATPLSWGQEWARLEPVLDGLRASHRDFLLSLDTRHPETARRALELGGVDWLNDVSGFESEAMLEVAVLGIRANPGLKLVFMHNLGVPAGPARVLGEGVDPVAEILGWARARLARFGRAGIGRDRLILDPGIGFGKSAEQSLEILSRAGELRSLGLPVLIGHSRKSCLAAGAGGTPEARDPETLAASLRLAEQGVEYVRVHAVSAHMRAFARG